MMFWKKASMEENASLEEVSFVGEFWSGTGVKRSGGKVAKHTGISNLPRL